MHRYKPQRIVVEEEVRDSFFTNKVLAKFPDIKPEFVSGFSWQSDLKVTKNHNPLTQGKKILYLKRYLGKPIKLCPGFSPNLVCCNYFVLDFLENCPLECTYCILQAIHNRPLITFHANVEEILGKIEQTLVKRPQTSFRIGTGEHSDSLALDSIFELNPRLVEFFAKIDNAKLELKTKSNDIEALLPLKHRGHTIISWSLSTYEISIKEEFKTANAYQRVLAAKEMVKAGYPVAFHLDPLIHYNNWKEGYRDIIDFLSQHISADKIAWLSMGTLRYVPRLKVIAEKRFPKMDLFCNEFVSAADGKMRYIRPLREELINQVSKWVKEKFSSVPLYLCMENSKIWERTMEFTPATAKQLEENIQRKVF